MSTNVLAHDDKLFEQILMLLGAVAHWETSLHGMELIPDLDLHHGQRHQRAMTNAMEGDLLNVGQNILEASIDEGTPSIDGIRGCIHH